MEETEIIQEVRGRTYETTVTHLLIWGVVVLVMCGFAVADYRHGWLASLDARPAGVPLQSLVLLLLALGCEFIDATIGMGYGTTLTPVLILMGYPVSVIVPCAVISQLGGNIAAAFFHHQLGNVDFLRDSKARNAAALIGGIGLLVAVATVLLAIRISPGILKIAVSISILGVGAFLLAGPHFTLELRPRNIVALGAVAAFNKAFSGGGYGPLVCGGQVLAGLNIRAAVATTAVAEAIVCTATAATYLACGTLIPVTVLLPLIVGSLLSAPASAMALRRLPTSVTRRLMGLAVITLGAAALLTVVTG